MRKLGVEDLGMSQQTCVCVDTLTHSHYPEARFPRHYRFDLDKTAPPHPPTPPHLFTPTNILSPLS